MPERQLDEEAIFHVARRIPDPDARSDYLQQVCGDNTALLARVQALLEVHEQDQAFQKSGSAEPEPTVDTGPITEAPGAEIGRYRLMEQIGEGGMGVVFVAEQERPVRRRVAMKIVKAGMDTKDVVARFEAERQALALMDHPNIAKVLDAGSTESGRPYFVMELVRGVPVTEYCDKKKLTVPERLGLFVQICQAVQHAHQKGIIHRDIKPTNVLVADHDGKPVPKVIDFGVAKATNQRLTERTIYTRLQQVIGTPMYMSPEQAEFSGLDVDTRSDIYSLGVLLYELLTGVTPFDKEAFEKAAYDDMRRIIREEEPPKPSTKISSLGETATSVSAHRGTDPRGLSRYVTGDLDVIAMKAIEKDRTRRYDTASSLAADVQRFLNDEPIVARAPSLAYRFGKFARRNRVAIVTSTFVLALMVVAIVATSWTLHRTRQTLRRLAEASYEEAVTAALAGDQDKAEQALEVAREAGASRGRICVLNGLIALNNGRNDEAVRLAEKALMQEATPGRSHQIGARALRATASIWAGYDDVWELELHRLRELDPETDTDRLLKAYALALSNPPEALRILRMTERIEYSPVGLFIRGETSLLTGIDRQDSNSIESAAQDFEYVQYLFKHSDSSLGWQLFALAAGVELARAEGRDEDVVLYTQRGRPLAQALEEATDYPGGDFDRWLFYRAIGDEEKASRAIHRVGRHPGSYCWFLAADCLRRHSMSIARNEFEVAIVHDDKESKWLRIAQAHLVFDSPARTEKVRALVQELVEDPSPLICRHALLVLCLVEDPARIQELAGEAVKSMSEEAYLPDDLFNGNACLRYLAGWDESKFLDSAREHGYSTANAHFNIAMMRLAMGRREEACEHLTKCVATNAIGSFDYEWGRAYLARMVAEPAWPNWLREENSD